MIHISPSLSPYTTNRILDLWCFFPTKYDITTVYTQANTLITLCLICLDDDGAIAAKRI